MAKADVLALVQSFALDQADPDQIDRLYDDQLRLLASQPICLQITTLPVTSEQATFTLPAEALAAHWVFYENRQLDSIRLLDLEALSPAWRDRFGIPLCYTQEAENQRTFRLYPKPLEASLEYTPDQGDPFGAGLPPRNVLLIYADSVFLPGWLELPMTLEILAQEFARDSRHTDVEFSAACGQVATLLSRLLQRA